MTDSTRELFENVTARQSASNYLSYKEIEIRLRCPLDAFHLSDAVNYRVMPEKSL